MKKMEDSVCHENGPKDMCQNEPSIYNLTCHESLSSSVVRAPEWCTGEGHGFHFCRGAQIFSLPNDRDKLKIPSFLNQRC